MDEREPCRRCPHRLVDHMHYRRGWDCGLCECSHFRTARPWWRRLVSKPPPMSPRPDNPFWNR